MDFETPGTGSLGAEMTGFGTSGRPLEKLSVLVISRTFERVHYALVLASAAAAIGVPATLFFTGDALRALGSGAGDGDGVYGDGGGHHGSGGWRALPAETGEAAEAVDASWRARGVAGFEELLSACADLGVRFIVCEMGLRAIELEASALRRDLPIEVAGVVTFLADASPDGGFVTL